MRDAAPQQPLQLFADADPHAVEPDMHLAIPQVAGNPFGHRRAGGLRQRCQPPQFTLALKHPQRAVHLQQNPVQTHHVVAAGFFAQIVKEQLRQTAQRLGELRQPLADFHHFRR